MYAGISKDFKERNSDCPETGHFQRIFYAYKEVFKSVLFEYPEDEDFIFIEDDVHLLNFQTLHSEVCTARRDGLQFYSFYRTPSQANYTLYLYMISQKYAPFHIRNWFEHNGQKAAHATWRGKLDHLAGKIESHISKLVQQIMSKSSLYQFI